MKKGSLIFGVAMSMCLALVFSGCESPTDGSLGASGLDGAVPLSDSTIDAETLKAVFKTADRIILLPGVTSVEGEIPAGKTLIVSGATKVTSGGTLEVAGLLEIFEGAELDATGISSTAGTLTGTGSVRGDGAVALPFIQSSELAEYEEVSPGELTYLSGNVTAAGKYAGSVLSSGSLAALTLNDISALFTLTGNDAITALTVKDVTALTAATIPANKTLTLIGDGNTITGAFDLSANTTGSLVVAEGAELAVSGGALKGSITNNGTITTAASESEPNVVSYITVPTGTGKVLISDDVTLSATTLVTLTQNVEIAANKTLTAPALTAAGPAFAGGKTITVNGTLVLPANVSSVGATVDNKGTITTATTSAAALNTILALKGTIASTASVTSSGAITVPADTVLAIAGTATFSVASGATLTVAADAILAVVSGATLSVAGTVDATAGTLAEAGGTITATGSGQIKGVRTYPLVAADGTDPVKGTPSLLAATAVQTADSSGKQLVTITVTSKAGAAGVPEVVATENLWGAAGNGKPTTGKFSDLALDLRAALTKTGTTYAIKSTNLGLRYYDGDTYLNTGSNTAESFFVTNTLIEAPQPEDKPDVYISTEKDVVFKWKKYVTSNSLYTYKTFGVLIWSGAATKTVTLEIDEVDTSNNNALTRVAKIVIDYSGVTFAD